MKSIFFFLAFLFLLSFKSISQNGESCRFPLDPTLEIPKSYESYNNVVLLDSVYVAVQPTGSGSFFIKKVIKVQNQAGALQNRIIKYEYDPLTAFAEFKEVIIFRANGSVDNVDVSKAYDYTAPARMIYWGAREIMIELGRLEPGDIISYEIAKKGFTYALLSANNDDDARFIPPMRGQFYDIVPFWVSDPTLNKVYKVAIPKEKELQFKFYQGECASAMEYIDDSKVYTFSSRNIVPFKKEPNMVDLFDAAPKLMMSTTEKWEDKSLWFYNVNEDYGSFDALPAAQKKVDELIKGKKTEMEKIAVLTHWVADNIRYSGISMGEGEGFTLHNTEMNYTDRCGVCKDIAGTLVSFLRMAGFEAYPAMTMAGSRVEQIPADHFNHCVAVVKLSDGTYMPLDPTWVPFCRELWSSAEQQQNYLPGVPEGSGLCITPISPAEDHYVRINAHTTLHSNGTLSGKFTIKAEGQSDRAVRRIFTTGWQSDWKNSLERELLSVSPKARVISVDYVRNPKDYQVAPIEITFKFEIPDYAIVGKDEIHFKVFTMNNLYNQVRSYLRVNTDLEKRNYGFNDACSRLMVINEEIQLPKGYNYNESIRSEVISDDVADFMGSLLQKGNKLVLQQELALKKRVYDAQDWDAYRNAVKEHKKYNGFIVIKK